MIYMPIVTWQPLTDTRDDIFFKFCKMRGVAFDVQSKSGPLFHLVDAIVSGIVSSSCIAQTRKRALEIAINTLNFIASQFGKKSFAGDGDPSNGKVAELQVMLAQLKYVLRRLDKIPGGSIHSGSHQPSL
jgi:hypothetical protein